MTYVPKTSSSKVMPYREMWMVGTIGRLQKSEISVILRRSSITTLGNSWRPTVKVMKGKPTPFSDELAKEIVDFHNKLRAQVDPPAAKMMSLVRHRQRVRERQTSVRL